MRVELEESVADSTRMSELLARQAKDQLKKLTTQEENLLDLAAEGAIPKARIQSRLRKIADERERLQQQEVQADGDLAQSASFIHDCLALLEDPAELYRRVGDTTRRMLNQAIFKRIYIYNDEVTGHELQEPLANLFALEAGHAALHATQSPEAAQDAAARAMARHVPKCNRATPKGSPVAHLAQIFQGQGSNTVYLVELRGIEPRSSSVDPGLLRVQSVMSLFSASGLARTRPRQAQSRNGPAHPP